MKSTAYLRKQFKVEAVEVTVDNIAEAAEWVGGEIRHTKRVGDSEKVNVPYVKVDVHNPLNERHTKAFIGDWILKSDAGFKVYTQKAFERAFEVETIATGQVKMSTDADAVREAEADALREAGPLVMVSE